MGFTLYEHLGFRELVVAVVQVDEEKEKAAHLRNGLEARKQQLDMYLGTLGKVLMISSCRLWRS